MWAAMVGSWRQKMWAARDTRCGQTEKENKGTEKEDVGRLTEDKSPLRQKMRAAGDRRCRPPETEDAGS
jgi:hypothetical protein